MDDQTKEILKEMQEQNIQLLDMIGTILLEQNLQVENLNKTLKKLFTPIEKIGNKKEFKEFFDTLDDNLSPFEFKNVMFVENISKQITENEERMKKHLTKLS